MRKHLHLIQFSRILVPLFVILLHADMFLNVYFNNGFSFLSNVPKSGGVYYFFALSGFMAYYLYRKDVGNSRVIKKFLYSRFIRIYPLYWLITFFLLLFPSYLLGIGTGSDRDIGTIFTSLLLIPNPTEPILTTAWSLVHTVFFYIVFSIVFIKQKLISRLILLLWAVLSITFSFNLSNSNFYFINFMFNLNSLIFLSGIVCAYLVKKMPINLYISILLIVIGIIGFPLSWVNTQYGIVNIDLQITTTLASILLILGCASVDLQKDIKLPKSASFLGDASFSIYLVQFPCMSFISIVFGSTSIQNSPNYLLVLILIAPAILCGCLVYQFIEKPLNKKLKNIFLKDSHRSISNENFYEVKLKL